MDLQLKHFFKQVLEDIQFLNGVGAVLKTPVEIGQQRLMKKLEDRLGFTRLGTKVGVVQPVENQILG